MKRIPEIVHSIFLPKELFGFVFGDKCGIVEDIAVNPKNDIIAYTG